MEIKIKEKPFSLRCRCPKCNHVFFTNSNKRKIIDMLEIKDMKIIDLCKELSISRAAIYHHIENLKKEDIIKEYFTKGKGKPHYISLKKK